MQKGKQKISYSPTRKETDKRTGEHTTRFAPDFWKKELKGKCKIRVCQNCNAVYYDKHWHSWQKSKIDQKTLSKCGWEKSSCYECSQTKPTKLEGKFNYEGEVMVVGITNDKEKQEILSLIRNVGKRAMLRDPEDRIIKIEDKENQLRILTTENQLAVSIGKQIDRSRKGGDLSIRFSDQDETARVIWTASK